MQPFLMKETSPFLHKTYCNLFTPTPTNQIIFNFSWDESNTQEKLETMVMQSLGGNKGGLWS